MLRAIFNEGILFNLVGFIMSWGASEEMHLFVLIIFRVTIVCCGHTLCKTFNTNFS